VRAKMVDSERGVGLLDYPWSSLAQGYALLPKKRSKWLKVEEGLRIFELPDTAAGRRRFIERLEERVRKEKQKECGLPVEAMCKGGQSTLRRGWFWGTKAFEEWLRGKVRESGQKPEGRALRTTLESKACHEEEEAEQIVRDGMQSLKMGAEELKTTAGSDPRKVIIAKAVHEKTAVTRRWTAARLEMKSAMNVSQQIKRLKTGKLKLPKEAKQWLSRIAP